ncbi:FadR/GntR family transcriptional regulator [Burkholderia sp. SCN-KJ]|uniref:FadR/GntR family transcriptional regulator n=1 Tax=Burkholderia sp. SCN-KJ TaxID=2969248 RepID=UPI00214FAB8A|nr:GntR family transcriptional regulator [Burkholderia sp. SCN-KJ]MCR4471171.1 GntR family transcriptional regulator [Burkholderia sp. SCN-KJ]
MNARPNGLEIMARDASADAVATERPPHAAADWLVKQIPAFCDATGALPPQAMLAQELGVSRATLREAVSQLIARGVVDVRTKVGSRVVDERQWQIVDRHVVGWRLARGTDPAFAADIAAIRRVLEPIAAADAALHATPEQRGRITVACAMRLAAATQAEYASARHDLHVAILSASSNQILQQLTCLVPTSDRTGDAEATAAAIPDGERQALALLEVAIRKGDAGAAREGIERLNTWDLSRASGGYVDA